MATLIQVNAGGQDVAAPIDIDSSLRRLPQVISRHIDRSRPFMVAIRRRQDFDRVLDELWVARGWKVEPVRNEAGEILVPGKVKAWPRLYLPKDCSVVVVYLPLGGGGASGGGSRSKSPLAVVAGIAGLALAAFAGPLAGLVAAALPGALAGSAVGALIAQGAFVIGGPAAGLLRSHHRKSGGSPCQP